MISRRLLAKVVLAVILAMVSASTAVSLGCPPIWAWVIGLMAGLSVPLFSYLAGLCRWYWMARQARASTGKRPLASFLTIEDWLPAETCKRVEGLIEKMPNESVLGKIDNDGRLLSFCGELPGFEQVDRAAFVERYRFDLALVVINRAVLIRKDYRGDRDAFLREWSSLAVLGTTSCTPAVHHVDEKGLRLYKSFIPGSTLRQRLVESGARILSVDTESDPELAGLSPRDRLEAVWARGRDHFESAVGPEFFRRLEGRLAAIHRFGVTGFSLTFGNVVLDEDGERLWFIDFDAARIYRSWDPRLARRRDRDHKLFRRIYGGAL